MKLLYVYFRYKPDCKRIFKDDIELNLDSEYQFTLAGDALNAVCSPDERLSDGFFSVLAQKTSAEGADSVSIVVGGNGVGKTALCEVLVDLKEETAAQAKFERYVLVYRKQGDAQLYCETNISTLQLPSFVSRAATDAAVFANLPLVYLSPNFSPYPIAENATSASFTDLSVISALKPTTANYYNPLAREFTTVVTDNPIAAFQLEQVQHMLAFAYAAYELPSAFSYPNDDDKLKMGVRPEGVKVSLSKTVELKRTASDVSDDVKALLAKTQGDAGDFVCNVFYAYAALLLIDDPIQEYYDFAQIKEEDRQGSEYEQMKAAWDQAQQYTKDVLAFCQKKTVTAKTITNFFKNADAYQSDAKALEAKNFFAKLTALIKKDTTQQASTLSSPDVSRTFSMTKITLADIQELVALHASSRRLLSFLNFDVVPALSSGEKAFFFTWGRMFHLYRQSAAFTALQQEKAFDRNDPTTWPAAEDAIIYVDDAETTLHPEWQRQQVKRTIWFFEAFVPWVHPHIIFATHSPILLSDVPRGNVIKLARDDNGETMVTNTGTRNTFAANIFDLYRDSFFLDQGTMGAFAASKVNVLLKKLAVDDSAATAADVLTQDDLKTANLIGDPFISHYVYRRLEERGKSYDTPEDEQGITAEGT